MFPLIETLPHSPEYALSYGLSKIRDIIRELKFVAMMLDAWCTSEHHNRNGLPENLCYTSKIKFKKREQNAYRYVFIFISFLFRYVICAQLFSVRSSFHQFQ